MIHPVPPQLYYESATQQDPLTPCITIHDALHGPHSVSLGHRLICPVHAGKTIISHSDVTDDRVCVRIRKICRTRSYHFLECTK